MRRLRPFFASLLCLLPTLAGLEAAPEIQSAEFGRAGEDALAVRVEYAGSPDPARMRVFIDTDPEKGEPTSGADFMVEGQTFYTYPEGATDWTWDNAGAVSYEVTGNTLTCVIPQAGALKFPPARVRVQSTTPEWEVEDSWPAGEPAEVPALAELPVFKIAVNGIGGTTPRPADLTELLAHAPRSLSVRFEHDYLQRDWQPVAAGQTASADGLPLVFSLRDAQSGETLDLTPKETLVSGNAQLLKGTASGLDWQIVIERDGDEVTATGRVQGAGERCFSLTAAAALDPAGWIWHDDVRAQRPVTDGARPFANLAGSPYGAEGQVSIYPFGVLSKGDRMILAQTEISEPRVFRIAADPVRKTFGVTWDMAISPRTVKFPGAATFQATWQERSSGQVNAFRAALQLFYDQHPAFAQNRSPTAGLWMPFADISKLPHPEDFGFGFFEKVGEPGTDVEYAHDHGVLTMRYTEPWLYWLPMAPGQPRNPESAIALMRQLGHTGDGRANAFGASGLLGGVREPEGNIRMKFMDVPWNRGARMEVSTDPDLAPTPEATINRAMAEWKDIQGFLGDPRTKGIYLDSMSAMMEMDYAPAAMAAADYPLTFTSAKLVPGLSTQIASFEFTAALGHYLHDRGQLVMGNFPAYDFPFYMPYIDIPGEETVWFAGSKYAPMADAKLNYRRAISGRKVWCFLLGAKFEDIPEGGIERYFTDCLFYGFQPSFFSHNGADDTYWSNPGLYERDRPLFKKYIPLVSRLALAGWQPVGNVRATDEALWVENYGDGKNGAVCHFTLRNPAVVPVRASLTLDGADLPVVALEPLTGMTTFFFPGQPLPVELGPEKVEAWDLAPVDNLPPEIDFLEKWAAPAGEGVAASFNLRSIQGEFAEKVYCQLRVPSPAVRGEENIATLEVRNLSADAVTLSGFGEGALLEIPAGETRQATAPFREAGPDGWLSLKWKVNELACDRRIRPDFAAPVQADVTTLRIVSRSLVAPLGLSLVNRSGGEKKVTIRWEGDFAGGTTEETLATRETRPIDLPIAAGGLENGYVTVTAESGGTEILRKRVYVLFSGENTSVATSTGVQVIADSTYPGYSTAALTDGVADSTNLPWNEGAWASDDNGQPHFVRVVLPQATELDRAIVHWQQEGGVRYTAQRCSLVGVTAEGETVELGEATRAEPEASTEFKFRKQPFRSVELRQPANAGARERPGILWLTELELK